MGQHAQGRSDCLRTGDNGVERPDVPDPRRNYKGELSAAAYAMANTGGWWTNKRMPDAVSDIQQAILHRKGRSMMGAAGAMRTAVCPHWNEVSIDDIY